MNRATTFLVVMLFLVCLSSAQKNNGEPTLPMPPGGIRNGMDLDAWIQGKVVPKTLADCQDYALQWQAWYAHNAQSNGRLEADYKALTSRYPEMERENERLAGNAVEVRFRIFIAFASVGAGLFLAFLVSRGIVRAVRRAWPLSFEHKQLAALILVAVWVSAVALIAVSDSRFSYHPVSSAFRVGLWSLPALVFGAVAFWWFGKRQPMRA
jgi:hypothetical protein